MEKKIQAFKEIAGKEEVAAKITATENLDEILAIFAENGLVLSADEFAEVTKLICEGAESEELSEEALEDVSGGGWIGAAIKVAYYCYKIYKAIKG